MLESLYGSSSLQFYLKETPTLTFSCEYCEIFKNTYFGEHLRTTASYFKKKNESAKWRAQRALSTHTPYVPYVPTRPTCPRAQVYFTDQRIKKWNLCTHTFLRVLSLILDLNFRNYRSIQTG